MQSLTAQLSNRFSSALVLFLSVFVTTQALALSPEEKIRTESLLAELGKQQNLTFTRNGTEHSAADAESHLRLKLRKKKNVSKLQNNLLIMLPQNRPLLAKSTKSKMHKVM